MAMTWPVSASAKRAMQHLLQSPGGRTFLSLWSGQTLSLLGTSMTDFALAVYVFERTGRATPVAITMLAAFLPQILLAPLAGSLVDRLHRRWALLLADLGQGASVLAIAVLLGAGRLEIWVMYLLVAVGSAAACMQWAAWSATVTLVVPEEHLGRADGLMEFGEGLGMLVAPTAAGVLVLTIGISRVLWLDVASYAVDAAVLLAVSIPRVRPVVDEDRPTSWLSDVGLGWRYIWSRPGLLGLLLIVGSSNLVGPVVSARLAAPLVLASTGNNAAFLGLVASSWGVGLVVGGALMAAWGGPRPRIRGALGAGILTGLLSQIPFGLSRVLPVWMAANFLGAVLSPIQGGSSQAIWQSQVPPEFQGRVFAVRRAWSQLMATAGLITIAPLADGVFRPAMNGSLGGRLAWLFGAGPERAYAATFVVCGLLSTLISGAGFAFASVREVESGEASANSLKPQEAGSPS